MEFNFLNDKEKRLLAIFLKRLHFDHFLDCTCGGNDKDEAYEMIAVVEKLQEELRTQGFNPR